MAGLLGDPWAEYPVVESEVLPSYFLYGLMLLLTLVAGSSWISARTRETSSRRLARLIESEVHSATESQARQRAESANHTKSRFLAHVTHELRTPLHSIVGYTELMAEEIERHGHLDLYGADIGCIRLSSDHLVALIDDILDLAKIESGHLKTRLEDVPLRPLLSEVVESVRAWVESLGNVLTLELPEAELVAHADPAHVRQIVLNLLSNAAKFTNGGAIHVRLSSAEHLLVDVQDTGVGIPAEHQSRIFEEFEQSHISQEYNGTGLGLMLCKHLARRCQGDVTLVESSPQGSMFRLLLRRPDT